MKFSAHRSAKAFTLIEVMLAATVMLAGIVGAIQVLVSGSEMLETSRKQAFALQIIDTELAAVRMSNLSGNWSSSSPSALTSKTIVLTGTDHYSAFNYPNSDFQNLIKKFSCTRTVTTPIATRPDFKQVTIKVTWTNHNGRTYTRSGTTYVGKNGLHASYQR